MSERPLNQLAIMSASGQRHQSWSHLREHSKIISYSDGHFTTNSVNLDKLVSCLDAANAKYSRVAVISVIGPPRSGKSFYTNLLIHYLQHDGAGGWMTNLSSVSSTAEEIEPLVGFSYGNVQRPENIVPDDVSGIYLWPQPFRVSNYTGKIVVWILHIHLNEGDRDDETVVGLFNELLSMLCSKVVEIKWNNDGIGFLEARHNLTMDGVPQQMLCQGIAQLCRTSIKPSKVILSYDSDAIYYLQELIPETLLTTLDGLDFVRIAHINDNDKPLHDDSGFLTLHTKMHERLDDAIKLIGDYKHIYPKLDKDGSELRAYQMNSYSTRCVQHMNLTLLKRSKQALETTFMSDVPSSSPPSHDNEETSSKLYPNTEDLSRDNINNQSQESSPFEVYEERNTSVVSTNGSNETRKKNEKKPKTSSSSDSKKQALRKEKVSSDNYCENPPTSQPVETLSASTESSTNCENGNEEWIDKSGEEPMEVDDSTTIDNAVMNVQEQDSEELKRRQEMEDKKRFKEECEKRDAEQEKLRAELEMKEKKRQEEEEKKAIQDKIEKLVIYASVEIKAGMLNELNKWLDHTLSPSTINDCGKIYENQYQQFKYQAHNQEALLGMKRSDIKKFENQLIETISGTRKGFGRIHEFVKDFHSRVNKNVATHGFFLESRLNELVTNEFRRGTMDMGLKRDEQTTEFVRRACNKLVDIYKHENRKIFNQEESLMVLECEVIREEYNKQMKCILGRSYFSPTQLSNIHRHLVIKLTDSLTTAFQFGTTDIQQLVTDKVSGLLGQFEEEFKAHKMANRLTLEELQKGVRKMISSSKAIYDGTMDKALRSHSDGLACQDFTNIHDKARQEARKSLENGIREKVGEREVGVHLKTLQTHIDNAWRSLMEENSAILRRREENRHQITEETATRRDSNAMGAKRASCVVADVKSQPSLTHTTRERKEEVKDSCMPRDDKKHFQEQKSRLNPLIFHLSLNHVRVVIDHENIFTPLQPVPAIIGITKENQWVWGVDDRLKEESTKVWLIRECFHPWHEKLRIGDNVNDITLEFLLGFLLGALKEHVEEMCNGEISQAVFIIPFWFTSSQRQQVKDAGTIAGFTENLLINENSAIAFRVTRECSESSDIVVLSENSGHVDATVYAYDKQKENLKMRGHNAVYEKKEKQKKQRPSMLSLEYWKLLTFGDEVSDSTGNAVHEAYKHAKRQAETCKGSGSKSRPKIIVVSFESENWKDVLVRTAQGITEKTYFVCTPCKDILLELVCLNHLRFYQVAQDLFSFTIHRRNPISISSSYEKIVQDNNNALPLNDMKLIISSDLPMYASKARFYQKAVNGDTVIGDLNVKDSMDDICVKLEINNEGIVSLHCVNARNRYSLRRGGSERITLDSSLYSWTCPNLNPDQIGSYASLLEYFKEAKKASKVSGETEQAKQGLIEKGEELIQRIGNKDGKFRSDLGRNMVKGQITEALGLLSHPKITTSDIEKQMDLFQKLEAKYFPQ